MSSPPNNNSNNSYPKWKNRSNNTTTTTTTTANINNNTIVLKNLDYAMNKDTLSEVIDRVMQRHGSRFTNVILVEDKSTRTFRGIAFVSFASYREASIALEEMAKVAINGRKVIAEFQRRNNNTPTNQKTKQIPPAAVIEETENCSPSNTNSPPSVNNTPNSASQMDKRAQFFANRDVERKNKRQIQQTQAMIEKEQRDKIVEAEFRKLLLEYAKGTMRNPKVSPSSKGKKASSPTSTTTTEEEEREEGRKDIKDNQQCEDTMTQRQQDVDEKDTEDSAQAKSDAVLKEDEVESEGNGTKSINSNDNSNDERRAKCEEGQEDLVFDSTLTSYERRMVHCICDELKLGHISRFDENGNRILRVTRDATRTAEWEKESTAAMTTSENNTSTTTISSPSVAITSGGGRGGGGLGGGLGGGEGNGNGNGNGNVTPMKKLNFYRPTKVGGGDENGGILPPSYKIYTPKRQPLGPPRDRTNVGFATRMKYHVDKAEQQKKKKKKSPSKAKNNKSSDDDESINNNDKKSNSSSSGGSGSSSSSIEGDAGGVPGKKNSNKKISGNGSKKSNRKQSSLNPSLPSFSPMNGLGGGGSGNGV